MLGFLLQPAHFLNGLEDKNLIDSGIACFTQTFLGSLNLPATDWRPSAIAVRDGDVGVACRIPEIDFAHVTGDDSKRELTRAFRIFWVTRVNPRSQRIVREENVVDQDAVLLNGSFFEWHKVEHERCRLSNAIRQADSGTTVGSQYSLLILGQRCCLYAVVECVRVDLGDVDSEPFFQFRAGHGGAAFRIIIALLFDIGKRRTFEPASAS